MKREYWLALALSGLLMMLPAGWLSFVLLLFVPGLALFFLLKDKFSIVELVAFSFTLSILLFPLVVLVSSIVTAHMAVLILGLMVIATGLYLYRKGSVAVMDRSDWPVLAVAALLFAIVLLITLRTFTFTSAGFVVSSTHASDLNFHMSIAQRYVTMPQIPPEDPYLPGYSIVYNWFMHVLMGEMSLFTGVSLSDMLKVIVPLVSSLIFLDTYLLARSVFDNDLKAAFTAALVYVASSGLSWAFMLYQYSQGIQPDIFKVLVYEWPGIMSLKYDPTSLFFFLPQTQTFGLLAMIFGLYLYIVTVRTKSLLYSFITGMVLASLVFYHMITAFPAFLALGFFFLYIVFKDRKPDTIAISVLPLVIGGISCLYQYTLLSSSAGSQLVFSHHDDVLLTLLASLGLFIPFALYGMYKARNNDGAWLLIIFAALNLLFINVLEMPLTSNTYRFLVYLAVPISVFAGLAFSEFLSSGRAWKVAIALGIMVLMVPSTAVIVLFYSDSSYTHATAGEVDALKWIKDNTPKNAVIFEEPGHFPRVPVLTGRYVPYAGQIYTIQYHNVDKQADMHSIMQNSDSGMVYARLVENGVNYVFMGSRESGYPFASAFNDSSFFKEVYNKNNVRIYEVVGVPVRPEVEKMDITAYNWVAFAAAFIYLLFLPGANIMRTLGWNSKKYNLIEMIVIAFGLSIAILVIVSLLLALPFSIGLNFYTLMIFETLVIIFTTKEVIGLIVKRRPAA